MPLTYKGKEVTKEEFKRLIAIEQKRRMEIRRLSQTELGREILKKKGIKPII